MRAAETANFRYATLGGLSVKIKRVVKPAATILALILGGFSLYLFVGGKTQGVALALIAAGSYIALITWARRGVGLPFMPMIVLQHVLVYGLPLIVAQETVSSYSQDYILQAGVELFVFFASLTVAWTAAMQVLPSYPPVCYALQGIQRGGAAKLRRVGFSLMAVTLGYQLFLSTGFLNLFLAYLPSGSLPILWGVVSAAGTCGFFIGSLLYGGGSLARTQKAMFWIMLIGCCGIESSSFLLSSALIMVITVLVGLFWISGRVPWIYVTIILLSFAFFNLGKVVMREKYWGDAGADAIPSFSLAEMPGIYAEWADASITCMFQDQEPSPTGDPGAVPLDKQSLLERINNIQNLLYVIDQTETHHIEPLYGKTYTLIPELLVPRILWPSKPGTHEGQALLNAHFQRQDQFSTTTTYIAWGLLPEAYGNFGRIWGSIFLGCLIGSVFAWMEKFTQRKLMMSIEGFVAFTIFLAMANSFEFVASVLVTSIEQAIIPIVAAAAPFSRRLTVPRAPDQQKS